MTQYQPIAIIGSGCRLPGGSTSPSRLWELLREPTDLSREIPAHRFNPDAFYHPDSSHHGTTNVRNAYLLEEDHRHFDAQFFQTKPVEAESMDPQQRILLETVYESTENAGLRLEDMRGSDTSVYVGVMGDDYHEILLKDMDSAPIYLSTGTARSILSNRVSYFFDWRGPSMTIDTACSSSLVALHQAVQSLQTGISRVAVAAGTNLILGPENFVAESKMSMLSPTGRSRMWDSSADGYARGDGFVAVVLKKLEDALADGDDIESVIRGSGINQDGRTRGITMPSGPSQTSLIRQVYQTAGLDINDIHHWPQYFEAHGTGTPTGDPIEASAIAGAFFRGDRIEPASPLVVGSIKTVIGHGEGAAGLCGLLKASLALQHGCIPPNLHLDQISPTVAPFYNNKMYIPTSLMPWPAVLQGVPRRASVNSFGFGGTNAHVILESLAIDTHSVPDEDRGVYPLIPMMFSGPDKRALRESIQAYLQLVKSGDHRVTSLEDLAYTLACRRTVFSSRVLISASSRDSLVDKLTELLDEKSKIGEPLPITGKTGGILGVFTGQGAQWPGMGRDLIRSYRFASDIIDRLEDYLRNLPVAERPSWSLRREILADQQSSRLGEAAVAQPVSTAIQIMLVDLLRAARVELAAVIGHSSGEIAAAYAAGCISGRDAICISYFRGLHASQARGPNGQFGAMMAVGTTLEDAQDLCDFPELRGRVSVAAINSSSSITLSGDEDSISLAQSALQDEGKFARILRVDKAYHSRHMDACSESYLASMYSSNIGSIPTGDQTEPAWYSSVSGALVSKYSSGIGPVYWNMNMVQPVLFSQAVASAIGGKGPYIMALEIGPHPALERPVLQSMMEAGAAEVPYIPTLKRGRDGIETVSSALGSIWSTLGEEAIDLKAALTSTSGRKPILLKDLPNYSWDHRRPFWHESQASMAFRTTPKNPTGLLGTLLPDGTHQEHRWRNILSTKEIAWLRDHQLQGVPVFPAAGYVAMALEASQFICGDDFMRLHTAEVRDLDIARPIAFGDDTTGVEILFSVTNIAWSSAGDDALSANFKCFSRSNKASATMSMTACGTVYLNMGGPSLTELSPRSPDPFNLVDVDAARFYDSLQAIGYGYSGDFKGLQSIKRRLGAATGVVLTPDASANFLIHPAMLDSVFQSIFVAYSWPGDGSLFSMHIPTHIARITINMGLARDVLKRSRQLPFTCTLSSPRNSPIYGDIEMYAASNISNIIIQVEGFKAIPATAPTPSADRILFQDIIWGLTIPDVDASISDDVVTILATLAGQATFRFPHLRILEASFDVGVKDITRSILHATGNAFSSYTIAFHTDSLVEKAKSEPGIGGTKRVGVTCLDVEATESPADIQMEKYGMVITTGRSQDSKSLQVIFRNLRRLLQPGGYLLMTTPLDCSQHATPPSDISSYQCDALLREADFSGIDGIRNASGTSVILSQAINPQILALREPLQHHGSAMKTSQPLYILQSHQSSLYSSLITEITQLLQSHFDQVLVLDGVESLATTNISPGATILSLVDLDEPTFRSLTAAKLEGLKKLLDQSWTVLWVTRGSLVGDPYANMIVGFGRTLLLEAAYLKLQFLDIERTSFATAEPLAKHFLQYIFGEKWSSSNTVIDGEVHLGLLWTTEPEVAFNKDGLLMIPRVIPSQERNDRYNSARRMIAKSVDTRKSVVGVEYHESSRSYVLREHNRPIQAPRVTDRVKIRIAVDYSSLLAINTQGASYVFLIVGQAVGTAQRVLALSHTQASFVSVEEELCVPLSGNIPIGEEPSFVSHFFWKLYAAAIVSCLRAGDVAVFYEPPVPLANAILEISCDTSIDLYFLTSSPGSYSLMSQPCPSLLKLYHNSSSMSIKSLLPANVTVFVTSGPFSPQGSDQTRSRVASCLPRFHRSIDFSALCSRTGVEVSTASRDISQFLKSTSSRVCLSSASTSFVLLDVRDVKEDAIPSDMVVLDWTKTTSIAASVEPVDRQLLFSPHRTYVLAGLAGDLGKSLTAWMVDRGARHIVITSRSPQFESGWLDEVGRNVAEITIYSNDITDKPSLFALANEIKKTHPPVAGVANGAMVLEDTPIAEMTIDKMNKVLAPKVQGSLNLDEVFGQELDFFILFSSVAAVVGNRGQSSYSAANAFMCSLAACRRARGLAATVIDIGAVVGTGYLTRHVSQNVQDYLRKAGYMWISESDFHQIFAEGVMSSSPSIRTLGAGEILSGLGMDQDHKTNAVWYNNPKFQHCVSMPDDDAGQVNEERAVKQTTSIKTELSLAKSIPKIYEIVTDAVTRKLRAVLLLSPETPITERTAEDLGIDSLVAVTLRTWFSKELGTELPLMNILGGATIQDLLHYTVEKLTEARRLTDSGEGDISSGLEAPELKTADLSVQSSHSQAGSNPISRPISSHSHQLELNRPEAAITEPVGGPASDFHDIKDPVATDLLPMSFAQSRFWFIQSFLEDPTTSNVTCLLSLRGHLRVGDLARAVKVISERHEGLRTGFVQRGGQTWQLVSNQSTLQLEQKQVNGDSEVMKEFQTMKQYVFDLRSGENMRILLLTLTPWSHRLIISYHHINMDGVSFMVLVKELANAYQGEVLSYPVPQYRHFSERQRMMFETGYYHTQVEYWKHEYSEMPCTLPILSLSHNTSRPPLVRYGHHHAKIRMDRSLRRRVQECCRTQNATPFQFFVAVFKVLLTRFSSAEDLSIGIAHAGRLDDKDFETIGSFLNLLPLRLRSSAKDSFAQALGEVKHKVYAALANASVPIDVLFSELGVKRATEHTPLFQAFVDYRTVQERQQFGNCEIEGLEYSIGRTGYDIALDVIDNPDGEYTVAMMVQKSLFGQDDATILLKSLLRLADAFSNDSNMEIESPSLHDPKLIEDSLLLGRGHSFQSKWEALPRAVDATTRERPYHVALKDGDGNVHTYEDMSRNVNQIARALLESGCRDATTARVAVFQLPSVFWISSMLAIMKTGAAYIPLDLRSGISRLSVILRESKASTILVDSKTADQVPGLQADSRIHVLNIDDVARSQEVGEIPDESSPDSTGVILYTSGSTGVPKGVALSHRSLMNQMESCVLKWGFKDEVVLQQSAYTFDFSLFQIYLALLTGGSCYIVSSADRGDSHAIADIIAKEHITVTGGVPSECTTWLQYGDRKALQRSGYSTMVCGGEPFGTGLTEELQSLMKKDLRVINIYGPTEVTISSNATEVQYNDEKLSIHHSTHVGYPLPNYSVYILDGNLEPVPAGVPGQIAISGPISPGYINEEGSSEKVFLPDPFASPEKKAKGWGFMHLSGDRGRLRPADGTLVLEGRMDGDTQIKLRGMRIDLREIESVIMAGSNGTISGVVVSVRGNTDQFLVAHVAMWRRYGISSEEERESNIGRLLKNLHLPQHMIPAIIVPLDALPVTVSGKIDRRAVESLPLPEIQRAQAPTTDTRVTVNSLSAIWHSVLKHGGLLTIHSLGPETGFFQAGGNSLLLLNLQARIQDVFGVKVPLVQLFGATSLAGMAATIDRILGNDEVASNANIVDWDRETSAEEYKLDRGAITLTGPLARIPDKRPSLHPAGKTVIITGATGFLGRHILSSLLANTNIRQVHCLAVRNPKMLSSVSHSDTRVTVHPGDLGSPRLGLSLEQAESIFQEADTIIHNGAEVSFLKNYESLRNTNVGSTKELVRMVLAYYRHKPPFQAIPSLHFVSTVGIAQLHDHIQSFGPMPASSIPCPLDGSNGYASTKWASERFLERLHETLRLSESEGDVNTMALQSVIHRPSSIVGSGSPRSQDIVQNLIEYCGRMRAIPERLREWWKGWIDLVDVNNVAENIVYHALRSYGKATSPIYVHHSGEQQIPVEELKAWFEKEHGSDFDVLPGEQWIERAKGEGMDVMVAAYMESVAGRDRALFTPMICKK